MPHYYIRATSFPSPFMGDYSESTIEAVCSASALESFANSYKHPEGLYSATCHLSDEGASVGPLLARWLSNHARALDSRTGKGAFRYYGYGPGQFELNGELVAVEDPKSGYVY